MTTTKIMVQWEHSRSTSSKHLLPERASLTKWTNSCRTLSFRRSADLSTAKQTIISKKNSKKKSLRIEEANKNGMQYCDTTPSMDRYSQYNSSVPNLETTGM